MTGAGFIHDMFHADGRGQHSGASAATATGARGVADILGMSLGTSL
jgi:hypothetical protein